MTKLVTPDAIDPALAGQLRSTQPHSREQQQQWLLTLEQAYLSLAGERQQRDTGTAAARDALPQTRDAARGAPESRPRTAAAVTGAADGAPAEIAADALARSYPETASPQQGIALEAALRGLVGGANPQGRGFAAPSQSSVARETGAGLLQQQRALGEIPELKSASLLRTEQGLQLVIRDLQPGDSRQLVARLRKLFDELNLPLVRITLNGHDAWVQAAPGNGSAADSGPNAVNKIF